MLGSVSQERGGKPDRALTQGKQVVTAHAGASVIRRWDGEVLERTLGLLGRMLKYRNSAALCWGRLLTTCASPDRGVERHFQGMTKKMEEWRQAYVCWEMRALRSKGRPDCVNLKESKTLALKIMWVLKEFFKLKLRELRKWKFRKWKHKQACRYRCQHFV